MSRPPLPTGSWGSISAAVERTDDRGRPVAYRAKTKFRDHDGRIRVVSAFRKTKTAAERTLLKKLQDRAKTGRHAGELTAMHKMNDLIDLYEQKFKEAVKDGRLSPTTLDNYQGAITNHIRPALGELRIGEATTPRIDTVVAQIKQRAGAARAKTCRSVLSGMMKLAVRYGAITVNPVREIETIQSQPKNPPRALTSDEITLLRRSLATDERAVEADLPDLVAFMLGTGVRIGEALAVLWHQVDLEASTVEITHHRPRQRRRPHPQGHEIKSRRTPPPPPQLRLPSPRFEALRSFTLQTGNDGTNWTTVSGDFGQNAFNYQAPRPDVHDKTFKLTKPVTASYVRFWADDALRDTTTSVQTGDLQYLGTGPRGRRTVSARPDQ